MYAIVNWDVDCTFSIVTLKSINEPRKPIEDYAVGDRVVAPFGGKLLDCKIYEIGENRAEMNRKLNGSFKLDLELLLDQEPVVNASTEENSGACHLKDKTSMKTTRKEPAKTKTKPKQSVAATSEKTNNKRKASAVTDDAAMTILRKRRASQQERTYTEEAPLEPTSDLPSYSYKPSYIDMDNQANMSQVISDALGAVYDIEEKGSSNPCHTCCESLRDFQRELLDMKKRFENLERTLPSNKMPNSPTLPPNCPQRSLTPISFPVLDNSRQSPSPSQTQFENLETTLPSHKMHNSPTLLPSCPQQSSTPISFPGLDNSTQKSTPSPTQTYNSCSQKSPQNSPPHPDSSREVTSSSQEYSSLYECVRNAVGAERRAAKVVQKAMRAVFTHQELVTCSVKGIHTVKAKDPRPGLPTEGRNAVIDFISSRCHLTSDESTKKMRTFLRAYVVAHTNLEA